MITSGGNAQLKHLVSLQTKRKTRDEEGVFVCEGKKMFDEVREQRPELLKMTYVSQSFYSQLYEKEPEYFNKLDFETVQDSVFREAAQTVTPQGILAIVEKPQYSIDELLSGENCKLLLLENIQDPGNLGTIVRTAEGAGMSGIILSKGSVDIFNPKVIRSTMGSILRVPFLYEENLQTTVKNLQKAGVTLYAAHLAGAKVYDQVKYSRRSAVLIGNEANGLSDEIAEAADFRIKIPMAGKVESLNAAVAAALIMYQMTK